MAVQFDPIAKDKSLNTTEQTARNIADVLAQELSDIATAISGGSDKAPKTDIATVEPTNVASRAYNIGELVYVNGNLYKVITAISSGATFTVGTNIQSTNVSEGLRGGLIKSASFSTTTDGYGLTAIASLPRIVVAVKTDQSVVCTVFYTANGYAFVRVTSQSGAVYANNPISGTYYYLEE